MKHVNIINTLSGPGISSLVFGTGTFWNGQDDKRDFSALEYYLSRGGNALDTARVYGNSESVIGRFLKANPKIRRDIIISTKGAHPPLENLRGSRMKKDCIDSDVETSLKLLGTDYIDIYYLHRDDISVPVSEIIDILNVHTKSGKIRYLGASNWTCARIGEANAYAKAKGLDGFGFSQPLHSLARVTPAQVGDTTLVCMNDAEYAEYLKNGVVLMPYSSQARGFFQKNFDTPNENIHGAYATPENLARLDRLRVLCKRTGISPSGAVIAYLTCGATPTLPIIGWSNIEQLKDTLQNSDFTLTPAQIDYLDGKIADF